MCARPASVKVDLSMAERSEKSNCGISDRRKRRRILEQRPLEREGVSNKMNFLPVTQSPVTRPVTPKFLIWHKRSETMRHKEGKKESQLKMRIKTADYKKEKKTADVMFVLRPGLFLFTSYDELDLSHGLTAGPPVLWLNTLSISGPCPPPHTHTPTGGDQ